MSTSSTGIEPKIAGLLCYILGWVSGVIFLVIEEESEFVKFHARQSIVLFGLLTVAGILVPIVPFLGVILSKLLGAAGFIAWVLMMVFAAQGKKTELPVVTELAEKLK